MQNFTDRPRRRLQDNERLVTITDLIEKQKILREGNQNQEMFQSTPYDNV